MTTTHVVQPGECLLSLAAHYQLPYLRLADANGDLLDKRKEPGILLPGDVVHIPERETKALKRPHNQRHRFRMSRDEAEIRIQFHDYGLPRAQESYYAIVEGERVEGETSKTDADGLVICRIPLGTEKLIIVIGEIEDEYEVILGHINPVDQTTGIHGRLANMDLYEGEIENAYEGPSIHAMESFLSSVDQDGKIAAHDPNNPKLIEILEDHYGS